MLPFTPKTVRRAALGRKPFLQREAQNQPALAMQSQDAALQGLERPRSKACFSL